MAVTYRLNGLDVACESPLPNLHGSAAPAGADAIAFRLASSGQLEEVDVWLVRRCIEPDRPWLSIASLRGGYLLRFHDQADFWVRSDTKEIACRPVEGCRLEVIEHLLVNQVVPHVLHLRGVPSFHASSVVHGSDGVIAFLGRSGSGKSTLAASFGADCAVVSDDSLALSLEPNGVVVHPSHPALRLRADSAAALAPELASSGPDKLLVRRDPPRGRLLLRRLYLLEPGDGAPAIERLGRRDALAQIARHVDRLDPADRPRLAHELGMLEAIVGRVPVGVLRYRRSFAELSRVHEVVRDDLRGDAA